MKYELLTTPLRAVSVNEGIDHQRLIVRIKRHIENKDHRHGSGKEYASLSYTQKSIKEVKVMENEIVEYQRPLTAVQVRAQVQLIQEVMTAVMVKDVHYGTIPGTQKPTLYKPGSEKILATFRIAAYPKEIEDLSNYDEIRYRVKVHGLSMLDGSLIGVGIGECSSSEEKYKWRRPVCDEEFNEAPEDRKRLKWFKGYGDKPPYQQKQIRTNPSDVANTVLKMAKKRGQIDMTLTATGASDVFDQDLEDLPEGVVQEVADKKPPVKAPRKKAPAKEAAEQTATVKVLSVASKSDKTKDGKPYTIFTIFDEEDVKYGTFSETFADLARSAKESGELVNITFTVGQYGNKITNLELAEAAQ